MGNVIDQQVRKNDCGISAVKTVCNVLNVNVSRNVIEDNIFLTQDGASLLSINKFFVEHGFKTSFSLLDINSINENPADINALFPCIVAIKLKVGFHYLVLKEFKNNKFTVLDPNKLKPYKLTLEKFKSLVYYSESPLDYVELEAALKVKVNEELKEHKIKLDKQPEHSELISLFNKFTYFSYLTENFGFKDKASGKRFLNDLVFNQTLQHIPKHFEGLTYNNAKQRIKIKAPVLLSISSDKDDIIEDDNRGIQNVYWRLFKSIHSIKDLWYIFLVTSIIASGISYVAVFINQILIDHVLPSYQLATLQLFAVGVGIFYLIDTVFGIYKKFISIHLSNALDRFFLSVFDRKISTYSLRYIHSYKRGDLTERLSDVMKLKSFFVSYFSSIFVNVLTALLSLFFLVMIDWKFSLIVVAVLFIFALIFYIITPIIAKLERERYVKKASFMSKFIEKIEGIQVIKAMGLEDHSSAQIKTGIEDLIRIHTKTKYVGIANSVVTSMVVSLSSLLLLVLTSREMIMFNTLTLGMIITFLSMSGKIFSAFGSLLSKNLSLQEHKVILKRFFDFDEFKIRTANEIEKEDRAEDGDVYTTSNLDSNLIFDFEFNKFSLSNVAFSYDDENSVIEDINLDISRGEKIWIKGRNGSGKSTLCKIIGLVYKPSQGSMMLNNVDVSYYDKARLRKKIVFISGEDILFNDTLMFNISLGRKIDIEKLVVYAKKIGIYNFINSKFDKFNFIIHENGKNLSTGQRKKILLLRALMTRTDLVILDEIFSGYDDVSKKNAEELIGSFEDRAFIIISHSNIYHIDFDQQYNIKNGHLLKQDS